MLTKKRIHDFQNLIYTWFEVNQRDLPWRHTHDPYAVLLSEVMLQQTQVDRVKGYWTNWLDRWPTFEALAAAPTADVIRAWSGLGYNRRAVNLQRGAQFIIDSGGFDLFRTPEALVTIPGIGPGTAGALMNFVWNIDTPFLEVNLKRIFQRLAFGPETAVGWAKDRELLIVAAAVLPAGQARIWPHALMDFGALACRPNDPWCQACPLGRILNNESRIMGQEFHKAVKKKPKEQFLGSNRYWRGEIIRALGRQTGPITQTKLQETLPDLPELSIERLEKLLSDLSQDGLIIIEKNYVSLP